MTSYDQTFFSDDQTLRSNSSVTDQTSQLSAIQHIAGSFDNLSSKTFDSGKELSTECHPEIPAKPIEPQAAVEPPNYSFAFIDESSQRAPSQATTETTNVNNENEKENEENLKPPIDEDGVEVEISFSTQKTAKDSVPANQTVECKPKESKKNKPFAKPLVPAKTKPKKHHHGKSKNGASTLPPEDPDFLDLLNKVTNWRMDDQRAQLKPIAQVTSRSDESSEAAKVIGTESERMKTSIDVVSNQFLYISICVVNSCKRLRLRNTHIAI